MRRQRHRGASSVLIAIFMIILALGATFFLIFAMAPEQSYFNLKPVTPQLAVSYGNGWVNMTNQGAKPLVIVGFDIFQNANAYLVQYSAYLNPGQSVDVFLNTNKEVVILTNEGSVLA